MSATQEIVPKGSATAGVSIDASTAEGETPGILVSQTYPPSVRRHTVEDYELEVLGNVSHSISFGVSTTALGAFLGMTPNAIQIISRSKDGLSVSLPDLFVSLIWVACGVAFLITGVFALKDIQNARNALANIRARPTVETFHIRPRQERLERSEGGAGNAAGSPT